MNGVIYTILEYLAWISLGLALLITILLCVTIARAISSAAHHLAVRWNAFISRRHRHAVGRTG